MKDTDSKELYFISRLSDYTLRSFLIRLGLVSATAWLFLFLAMQIAGDPSVSLSVLDYFWTIVAFNVIGEVNVLLDHLAERFLPIPEKISIRLLLHIAVSLLLGTGVLIFFLLIGYDAVFFTHPIMQMMILLGLIFIFIMILVSITLRITEKWIFSTRKLDEMKNLKLVNDYQSLQAQLNPHFLFNNLSVLKSMISYEPEAAIQFTQHFTDVYRYVLQSKDKTTVKLADELAFLGAYISLHQERMGKALLVKMEISEDVLQKELPPLASQLLVENAIKHNIALSDSPLEIRIHTTPETLIVSNNLNPKATALSEKTGLQNLRRRYALLTDKAVLVQHEESFFQVEIPLL